MSQRFAREPSVASESRHPPMAWDMMKSILTVTRENRVLHVRAAEVRVVRLDIVDLHIVAILDVDVTLIKAVVDDIAVLGLTRDIDVCGGSSV